MSYNNVSFAKKTSHRGRNIIRSLSTEEKSLIIQELSEIDKMQMNLQTTNLKERLDIEYLIANIDLLLYNPKNINDFSGKKDKDAVDQIINKLHSYWHGYKPDFILTDRDEQNLLDGWLSGVEIK